MRQTLSYMLRRSLPNGIKLNHRLKTNKKNKKKKKWNPRAFNLALNLAFDGTIVW